MHQETLASAPYDTPPRPTRMMAARYPEAALRAHVEGVVEVEILVGEEGEVAYVEVRRSIPLLDEAALACVRKWRFSPALRGGKATAATASAPVFFTIPKDSTR
jgi:periplasmic protein TonB